MKEKAEVKIKLGMKAKMCVEIVRANIPVEIPINNALMRKTVKTLVGVFVGIRYTPQIFDILLRNKFIIPRMDFVVTTRCSLRCKYCSNLMPYFKHPKDFDAEFLKDSIDKLLDVADEINEIRVIGGEAFVYKDLAVVLNFLVSNPRICHVNVFTNATILPKDRRLIRILQNRKIRIMISDYGKYSRKLTDFEKLCKREKIKHIINFIPVWSDAGDFKVRNRKSSELKKQMRRCNTLCHAYVGGVFYYCERAASATMLNFIPDNEVDSVNIMNDSCDVTDKRERLIHLMYKTPFILCCNYCDTGTDDEKEIEVAKQIRGPIKI